MDDRRIQVDKDGKVFIFYPEKKPCRSCEETQGKCSICDGKGTSPPGPPKGLSRDDLNHWCGGCGGTGRCGACGGTGWV